MVKSSSLYKNIYLDFVVASTNKKRLITQQKLESCFNLLDEVSYLILSDGSNNITQIRMRMALSQSKILRRDSICQIYKMRAGLKQLRVMTKMGTEEYMMIEKRKILNYNSFTASSHLQTSKI